MMDFVMYMYGFGMAILCVQLYQWTRLELSKFASIFGAVTLVLFVIALFDGRLSLAYIVVGFHFLMLVWAERLTRNAKK